MGGDSFAIFVLLASFFLMIILRFPIAYAVALSSVFCLVSQGLPLTTVCQQMVKGISSFSLMAVPFFITMGCLMGTGGISEKLIALADACVGWMRGGMAMVNIVASYFFGGISGSAAADTASLGTILIPMMVDQGYDADFSTAVTITSSCEGLLVPPSHNMVIYATTAGGISVGSLFLAGYIPGALLALSLMVGSYIISVKRNYPKGDKFSISNLIHQLGVSFWALAAVLIVVFGVVCGWFTATESAAIAVIYSLIVSVYIYKGLDWKGVWRVMGDCVDTLAIVLILIATSNVFGYCLTRLHVPDLAAGAITGLTTNPIILALLLNLILLVLGCNHGYGSDHPDRDADSAADRHLDRHRPGTVWHHRCIKLRHRSSDPAGRLRPVHRIGSGKAADGEGSQGDPAFLSLHDRDAAPDHLHSGDQFVAAPGAGIIPEADKTRGYPQSRKRPGGCPLSPCPEKIWKKVLIPIETLGIKEYNNHVMRNLIQERWFQQR